MTTAGKRSGVFVSYSHSDERWLKRLQVHVRPLVRAGDVAWWDDTLIKPGDDWRAQIEAGLASARVAVLLISADFLASEFIATAELPQLLAAAETDGAVVLPLILTPSQFENTPSLSRFQAVNAPDRPLARLPRWKQEEFLSQLAEAIASALATAPEPPAVLLTPPPVVPPLLALLELQREACEQLDQRFLTPHLLLALLQRPDGFSRRAFDAVRPGVGGVVYQRLTAYVSGGQAHGFEPFRWEDNDAVVRAGELALAEGRPEIDDRDLLLAVLESGKATVVELERSLGADDFQHLVAVVRQRSVPATDRSQRPDFDCS